MPRYRVVLEFDHPGDGTWIQGTTDKTCSPARWRWDRKLDPECENVHVEVFEAAFKTLQIHDYERGVR